MEYQVMQDEDIHMHALMHACMDAPRALKGKEGNAVLGRARHSYWPHRHTTTSLEASHLLTMMISYVTSLEADPIGSVLQRHLHLHLHTDQHKA